MLDTQKKIWNATLYLRLSRDDDDKEESNSIPQCNERDVCKGYQQKKSAVLIA